MEEGEAVKPCSCRAAGSAQPSPAQPLPLPSLDLSTSIARLHSGLAVTSEIAMLLEHVR